jgi:glutamate carboxypeptidase
MGSLRQRGRTINLNLAKGVAGGASHGHTTSLYTATFDGLGAVGDGAHAKYEGIYFAKMVQRGML